MNLSRTTLVALLLASPAAAQTTTDPFPTPIRATEGVIRVNYREFATVPAIAGVPARMMLMTDEPGARNYFVNDMRGPLYRVSADGRAVTEYVNIDDPAWGYDVQSQGAERGFQSFAFHPQFNQRGTPGYGKFYTWTDVTDKTPAADFGPGDRDSHDTVLLEWTARNPGAAKYDGEKPRELMRLQQPYANHNGGLIAFNPLARAGSADFGKLYIGNADGGSGGDPLNLSQNMASIFGKILRIDPLGKNSSNGKYGIPADNPFVSEGRDTLPEIWASGVRNPQRFGWDSKNGNLYVADIGQNIVEEVSPVRKGANLGWVVWEGSFRYGARGVDTRNPRTDAGMIFPIVEYDHTDPLFNGRAAITGLLVYRSSAVRPIANLIVFGDNPSGEIFAVSADHPPNGGQDSIRRILLNDNGQGVRLLDLIRKKNAEQGAEPAPRVDLRFGYGRSGEVFLLNKRDGVIRQLR